MRIGVNCLPLQKEMGGLRQDFQRLFRELLASDEENSYVFFYADKNLEELALIGNDRWLDGCVRVGDHGEILPHLMKVDLFFCPFNYLWPRPLPVASVVKLADIQEVFFPQFFSPADLEFRRVHFSGSTRAADAVITFSEYSKRTIAEHHGVDLNRIFVAPSVVDESFAEPPAEEILARLLLPERFVFYPANQWPHKNHDSLLRSLAYLKTERNVSIPCILTGFSHGFPLKEKISEYGLEDQVRDTGYLSNEEIRCLYHRATLLCFPSLYEGFGMPIIEAMQAGCPVTCSRVTSLPEVAGEAALYFNPTDPVEMAASILKLWTDENLRSDLIERGKTRAKAFTATNMVGAHCQAFEYAYKNFNKESRLMYEEHVYKPLIHSLDITKRLHEIDSSFSWRITKPLRALGDWVRK